MTKIHYAIVEHDGGFAYKLDDVFSETFPSREAAAHAANVAAAEQELPGETEEIEYQDAHGRWTVEHSDGDDRPEADVAKD